MGRYYDNYWPPYVPVAERRRRAARKVAKMKKAGKNVSPVEIAGSKIAKTFWGQAWCRNLEAYSDYSNRLPRGRTYVRNGSVIDLKIEAGRVRALVSGTDLYTVDIEIKPLAKKKWKKIKGQCAGQIDSLVELLRGSIAKGVMEVVTRKGEGLFPSPDEITLNCSCPDWATMCKHVAATLYGVGAHLDDEPELLFTLRGVDPTDLVEAAIDQPPAAGKPRRGRALETNELSSVFGVDIDMDGVSSDESSAPTKPAKKSRRAAKTRKSAAAKKTMTKKKRTIKKAPQPSFLKMNPDDQAEAVFEALWLRGPVERKEALKIVAEDLRDKGLADFRRFRNSGILGQAIGKAVNTGVKYGYLDRPRRGYIRAILPDANLYTKEDWRTISNLALRDIETIAHDEAILVCAEYARDQCGLEFKRLRKNGAIRKGLEVSRAGS